MVISHKYRYCFVELPHTASSAIQKELVEHYDGIRVLHKHATYVEFLRLANAEEKRYFVFSGIRNPLDEAVSLYFKFKNNHSGNYTNPAMFQRNGGFITEADLRAYHFIVDNDAGFGPYLREFYKVPYDNWSALSHADFDYVVRFEHLQEDFAEVLKRIGIPQVRPLPAFNVTEGRSADWLSHYTPDVVPHAARIFGPFLEEWGYGLPPEWGPVRVPAAARVQFALLRPVRRMRWRLQAIRSRDLAPIPREAA